MYSALSFFYYFVVICNEMPIQLTVMQIRGAPELLSLHLDHMHSSQ